jgi:hypothetical protein
VNVHEACQLIATGSPPSAAGCDIELAAELSQRFLAAQNPLDRGPLELRAEDASAVCLPPVFAHGALPLHLTSRG